MKIMSALPQALFAALSLPYPAPLKPADVQMQSSDRLCVALPLSWLDLLLTFKGVLDCRTY